MMMMGENTLINMMKAYEEKLKEFMAPGAFAEFARKIAKDAFRTEVEAMEDSDYKDFILENFDKITSDKFDA